ncbi:ATP-binding protein [Microcella sp.]|uniref:ATP-binding protein n=1 Tax=Microcella sp. TaxID=1913979 RepID=UPI002565CF95|nr:ATP-binding protein [Microcella sp.]MBX9472298.1 ATP-binding protein [Microcella sp.]
MTDFLPRHAAPVAREYLEHFPGIVIEGARQVGKSTLAQEIAQPDALIRTLDDEQVRAAAIADPAGFIAESGERQQVIDEIQRMPSLTLAIKASIDRDRRPGRFILTGSASLLRVRGTVDSLAGRVGRMNLHGLSRGEIMGTADDFVSTVIDGIETITSAESHYTRTGYAALLAAGSYPEIYAATPRVRTAWFEGYVRGVVERDMSELKREVRPARSMAVLRTLAGRQSAELVKATLASETTVPATTITGYLDLVHDVGLVASLPPWTPNLAKREIGRPKTFIADSGLALWLARVTPDQLGRLEYGEAFGAFLEAFVAAEFLKQRTWSARPYDIFHWRDRDGGEVDIVIELNDGSVIGIEVKSASSFTARQFTGLARMRDALGSKFVAGIVLNTSETGYRYADRLYGAPVSALWN